MKECNKVFFGEKGITSTSANHLANIANECLQELKIKLEQVSFLNTYLGELDKPASLISGGVSLKFLDELNGNLKTISNLNSFIAWVREAIRAKEEELDQLMYLSLEDYCKMFGEVYPVLKPSAIREEDILGTWSIKDRAEYYSLEAEAAALGKYIHKEGAFSKARKLLQKRLTNMVDVDKSHSTVLCTTYEPSVEPSKVEDAFFELQRKHREVSAELNKLKARLENERTSAVIAWEQKRREDSLKYEQEYSRLSSLLTQYKKKESKNIGNLKIVIPNSLQETYDFLSAMAGTEK